MVYQNHLKHLLRSFIRTAMFLDSKFLFKMPRFANRKHDSERSCILKKENLNGVLAKLAQSGLPFALIIHTRKFRTENRTF